MSPKNLREWINYVESSTIEEKPENQSRHEGPSPALAAKTTQSQPFPKSSLAKPRRRPESWNLTEGKIVPATAHPRESEAETPAVKEASASTEAKRATSLSGDWVGDPIPKPKAPRSLRTRSAETSSRPIKTPRVKVTEAMRLIREAIHPVDLTDALQDGDAQRSRLFQRLVNPELSLRETALLLNVCPTTIRRYTNSGILPHHRGSGNHRRFWLKDIVMFVDHYGGRRKESGTES
ncbi:MAG: helix-turn-helix domain-containing protein [Armatimonadetes bacterium]|nr:helix-turn-helix domain-containing protein [Armatimonadota bacterium]